MKAGVRNVARNRERRVPWILAMALASACKDPPQPTSTDASPVTPATSPASAAPSSVSSAPADVTSGASSTWTEGPSVMTGGSVDAEALRKKAHARIDKDTSAVHVLEGGTARELGQRACEAAVPKRPADTKVLIKPNIGGFEWFKDPEKSGGDDGLHGRITDPEFVRGIIHCLKARGHTKITIAEGWGATHADWVHLARASGYEAMTRDEGVTLVAMDDDGVFDVEGDTPGKPLALRGMEKTHVPTLLIPKILAEHLDGGLYISAPKVKVHRYGVFSASIKGMQGTVMMSDKSPAFRQKSRMHREIGAALAAEKKGEPGARKTYVKSLETFAERIADVLEIEAPHVVLAEGAPAMGGDGFGRQWPAKERVAIAGTNPILVDRVVAQYLGFWHSKALAKELEGHETSPLLTVAAKRFGIDIESPTLAGNGAALLASPRPAHLLGMAGFEIHEGGGAEVKPRVASTQPSLRSEDAGATEPAKNKDETVVHATHFGASDAPKIDGAIDASWAKATKVRWDTDWSGKKTGTFTSARFGWSEGALYVLWELEGTGLFTDTTRPIATERSRLYQEDCVELFLTPDPRNTSRYFEIEAGPYGHWFDIDVDRAHKREDVAWSSGVKVGTTRDAEKKTAIIETAMSAPDVTAALRANAKLPVGLYRMEGRTERKYLAYRPTLTAKPNFHVPEAFATLVLDP